MILLSNKLLICLTIILNLNLVFLACSEDKKVKKVCEQGQVLNDVQQCEYPPVAPSFSVHIQGMSMIEEGSIHQYRAVLLSPEGISIVHPNLNYIFIQDGTIIKTSTNPTVSIKGLHSLDETTLKVITVIPHEVNDDSMIDLEMPEEIAEAMPEEMPEETTESMTDIPISNTLDELLSVLDGEVVESAPFVIAIAHRPSESTAIDGSIQMTEIAITPQIFEYFEYNSIVTLEVNVGEQARTPLVRVSIDGDYLGEGSTPNEFFYEAIESDEGYTHTLEISMDQVGQHHLLIEVTLNGIDVIANLEKEFTVYLNRPMLEVELTGPSILKRDCNYRYLVSVERSDEDHVQLYYQYYLDDSLVKPWSTHNHFDIGINELAVGSYQLKVEVSDSTQLQALASSTLDITMTENSTDATACSISPPPDRRDSDFDGIYDSNDNCVDVFNPMQTDSDFDNIGDACDEDI